MRVKILYIQSGKEVQTLRVSTNKNFKKNLLGDNILKIHLENDIYLYINANYKVYEFNRFYQGKILFGDFIIISLRNNKAKSMSKNMIEKYINYFRLSKHYKKIDKLKENFLEEYYYYLRKNKEENSKRNMEELFNIIAA